MDVTLRTLQGDEDYSRWVKVFSRALHEEFKEDGEKAFRHLVPDDRAYAAEVDGEIIGTACDFPLTYRLPGGELLPIAAVSGVSVLPTHRRRGVLRQMMTRQLHDARDRGEALAALGASESAIYGRFGYGPVEAFDRVAIETRFADLRHEDPREGTFRFVEGDHAKAELDRIFHRATADHPGEYQRSDAYWAAHLADPEAWRDGGVRQNVTYRSPSGGEGYVSYRIKEKWEAGLPANTLAVEESWGTDPQVARQLWRFVLEVDLVRTVTAWVPKRANPLPWMLRDPRRVRVESATDHTWLRIVDLPRVLSSRRYDRDGRLVLEVTDDVLEANAGRWSLEVEDGSGTIEATTAKADLRIDIADLASLLMGNVTVALLTATARADAEPEAARRTDELFGLQVVPWAYTGY